MNKFKVGDKVKVSPIYYGSEERNKIGVIHFVDVVKHYQVIFDGTKNIIPLIPEEYLELVEPEKGETTYEKIYVRGLPREIPMRKEPEKYERGIKMNKPKFELGETVWYKVGNVLYRGVIIGVDNSRHHIYYYIMSYGKKEYKIFENDIRKGELNELDVLNELVLKPKQQVEDILFLKSKIAFQRDVAEINKKYEDFLRPSWFEPRHISGCRSGKDMSRLFEIDKILEKKPTPFLSDLLDAFEYSVLGERKEDMKMPNKVIFNESKEKVTLLFGLNGKPPYEVYTSKTDGKDHYSKEFGFYLSFYKYLNRDRDIKPFLQTLFSDSRMGGRIKYLKGAVHALVNKDMTDIETFETIVKDILEQNETWTKEDYQKRLKLKKEREKRMKERRLLIDLKEKEIEKLRKENDKETLNYLKAITPKDKLPFEG